MSKKERLSSPSDGTLYEDLFMGTINSISNNEKNATVSQDYLKSYKDFSGQYYLKIYNELTIKNMDFLRKSNNMFNLKLGGKEMKIKVSKVMVVALLTLGTLTSYAMAQGTVEVLHWWTSGGEAKAMAVLKEELEKTGNKWLDSPIAGGGGEAAMTTLKSRVVAGNPPSAVQLKGPAIQEWGEEGALANLTDVGKAEKWDELLPPEVSGVMKYKGNYVASPVNVHRVNWLWANPEVFQKAGAKIPTTLEEFFDAADKIQKAGFIAIAHGGQAWQDATVFEEILLGVGGAEFYRKVFVEHDPKALDSPTMIQVFDLMRKIKGYIDKDSPGRDWNLATAMVINGKAGMQFMGDWAKGEFLAAGKVPGKDFVCVASPNTSNAFIFNIDSFVMFQVKDSKVQEAQKSLARIIMGPKFQEAFNLNKGSIPARLDVSMDKFDSCAQDSKKTFVASSASKTLVPSFAHDMATSPAARGALQDVITKHFNSDMSSAEAAKKLVSAISAVK